MLGGLHWRPCLTVTLLILPQRNFGTSTSSVTDAFALNFELNGPFGASAGSATYLATGSVTEEATGRKRNYFTRSFLPRRRVVVSLMPFRRQRVFTEVWYFRARAPRVSP